MFVKSVLLFVCPCGRLWKIWSLKMYLYAYKYVCMYYMYTYKWLHRYDTAQFKLDIYTLVKCQISHALASYTRENHLNIHLHICHSRVVRQIYQVTRELHVIWTSLSCHSWVAREHWTNLLSYLQVACECMIWCTHELCYSRGTYTRDVRESSWITIDMTSHNIIMLVSEM